MKKFALILLAVSLLAFAGTSCENKGTTDMDEADSLSTMPAEAPAAAPDTDTVALPPVDPAMDTSQPQTPKM